MQLSSPVDHYVVCERREECKCVPVLFVFCHIFPVPRNHGRVKTCDLLASLWVIFFCRLHLDTEFFVKCGNDLENEFGPVSVTSVSYIRKLTSQRFMKMSVVLADVLFPVSKALVSFK